MRSELWFERTKGFSLTPLPDGPAYMQELQIIRELTKKLGITRFPTNCLPLIEFTADYKEHMTSPVIGAHPPVLSIKDGERYP